MPRPILLTGRKWVDGLQSTLPTPAPYMCENAPHHCPHLRPIRGGSPYPQSLCPVYSGILSPSDFSFTSPKIPGEMVPKNIEGKSSSVKLYASRAVYQQLKDLNDAHSASVLPRSLSVVTSKIKTV
ncbi:hypothetical protein MUK42_21336 [Musa troglodytarum]|uniref:Uncharacterized protein n=1 Tax=Musa troglodytarum TaxID=320322 RepID=A0A9E7JKJ6_9LILI|nr:hypothetical protein MUK42_21336 [Musa troglodytarum]